MKTVDLHLDTPWKMTKYGPFDLNKGSDDSDVSTALLKRGGLDVPVYALYLPDSMIDKLKEDGTNIKVGEQISWFKGQHMALEGSRLTHGSIERLREINDLVDGLVYMTMTHNKNTPWADSATDHDNIMGLTDLGEHLVRECYRLGILVDISHSSDLTALDIIYLDQGPVIASHSGCRKVLNHPRNLPDDLITKVAESGGFIGIPFAAKFVGPLVEDFLDHVDYATDLVGVESVVIGSDIDGASMIHSFVDVSDWKRIVLDGLSSRGYNDREIALIAGGNLEWLQGN